MPWYPAPLNRFPTTPEGVPASDYNEFYRQALHNFIDVGVGLARTIEHTTVTAIVEDEPRTPRIPILDTARAFDLVGSTVRRTIMLAARLGQPEPQPATRGRSEPATGEPTPGADPTERLAPEHGDHADRPDHLDDDLSLEAESEADQPDARPVHEHVRQFSGILEQQRKRAGWPYDPAIHDPGYTPAAVQWSPPRTYTRRYTLDTTNMPGIILTPPPGFQYDNSS